MGSQLIHIMKQNEDDRHVLYYFTDYGKPLGKITTPLSRCVEGFVEIDKVEKTVRIKECTPLPENSPRYSIIERAILKAKKALEAQKYPDRIDYMSG